MKKVIVCTNFRSNPAVASCAARNSEQIADLMAESIAHKGINIALERFQCLGWCNDGPVIKMSPNGDFCAKVQLDDIPRLLLKIEAFANDLPAAAV